MSYALDVNLPNVPKGEMVEIVGLGTYENGKTSPVPNELLQLWELHAGATLEEANFQEGIKVKRAKSAPPDKKEDDKKEGGN